MSFKKKDRLWHKYKNLNTKYSFHDKYQFARGDQMNFNTRSKKLKRKPRIANEMWVFIYDKSLLPKEQSSTQKSNNSLTKQNNDSSMIPSISPQLPPHITESPTNQLILTFPPCHLIILSFLISPRINSPYFGLITFVTEAMSSAKVKTLSVKTKIVFK
jgi:hypothetical protein